MAPMASGIACSFWAGVAPSVSDSRFPEGVRVQVDDGLGQLGFRREVVIEAALADVGGLAELVHADRLIAAFEEQLGARRDDPLASVRRTRHGPILGDS